MYGWHRLAGLWLGLPALVLVLGGVLLAFEHGVQDALGASVPPPTASVDGRDVTSGSVRDATDATTDATRDSTVDVGHAIATALALYPGATLSGLSMPGDDSPWYRIRVRAPGELPRNWGTTYVYVGAADGHVLATDDARTTHAGRRAFDVLYPLHTGQIGGAPGRAFALAIGAWLTLMIVLGLRLYLARRRPR